MNSVTISASRSDSTVSHGDSSRASSTESTSEAADFNSKRCDHRRLHLFAAAHAKTITDNAVLLRCHGDHESHIGVALGRLLAAFAVFQVLSITLRLSSGGPRAIAASQNSRRLTTRDKRRRSLDSAASEGTSGGTSGGTSARGIVIRCLSSDSTALLTVASAILLA